MITGKKIADAGYVIKETHNAFVSSDPETLSMITKKVAGNVFKRIEFMKGYIVPRIDKLGAYYQDQINALNKDPDTILDIKVLKEYDLIENLNDANILDIKGNGELNPTSINIPPVNKEDVRSHYVAPTNDVNLDIKPILDSRSDDELLDLWDKYFNNFNKTNALANNLKYFNYRHIEDIQLLYVLCRNFEDEVPDTVVNGLDRVGTDLLVIKEFILSCMKLYRDYYNTYLTHGRLIHKVEKKDAMRVIYVVEGAYVEFLSKSAHGNDTISGYVYQLDNDATGAIDLDVMLENDFKYYHVDVTRIKSEKLAEVSKNKRLLEAMYIQSANNIVELLSDSDGALGALSVEGVVDHINRLLSYPDVSQVKIYRPKEMAYLIIGSLYPAIKQFLDDMVEVSLNNPNMNANETALYASINMVTSIVTDQYELDKRIAYRG